jgi:hypothetical protein
MHKLRTYINDKTAGTTRIHTIKFKINGRCVNNCRFCPFHNDPHLLEVRDIEQFFDMASGRKPFKSLVVNGGEPTIHPRFIDICNYLKDECRDRMFLSLGTNLIPFSWDRGRYTDLRKTIYETFHRIEVGCDDEHRNIHLLERFAPEIVAAGIVLDVNVMPDYCSEETRERILAVKEQNGLNVTFSELHHYYESLPVINDTSKPCRNRTKDLLVNCNGDLFFCFHQEMETPICNLFTVTGKDLDYYLERYDPREYHFCACCPRYIPESSLKIGKSLKKSAEGLKRLLIENQ